jgi:hypothetical protein
VNMRVAYCQNTTTYNKCKSHDEITQWINDNAVQMSFIFVNSYFDSASYDEPIKSYLDDTFYWTFLTGYTKKTNIYLKKNKLELSDTYLSGIVPETD